MDGIAMIEQFTPGMDFERFRANPTAAAAAERNLQVISEAAIRLCSEAEQRIPDRPWRDIGGIGNRLRHSYERIDLDTIWNAVTDDLPLRRRAAPPPSPLPRTVSVSRENEE